jgi:hypothetical protein
VTDAAVTPVPRRGITVVMVVVCVLLTLLASVTFGGITAPIGIVSALGALWLAILVLRRTPRGTRGRIAASVLVGFTVLPWALIAAFWIYISFFDQLPPSSGT